MQGMNHVNDRPSLSIRLNGEERAVASQTVMALLEELGIPLTKVAVEQNRAIVPKSTYADTALAAGDEIEIVQFVGGG
ncbi:MAG: sulfur carrier protein ThiS [Pseudomonadota bacterium]